MTCDHLSRLLALFVIFCAAPTGSVVQGARDFEKKASMLLKEEPKNPKCFAEGRKDFTCFWEEDEERAGSVDQYSFTYTYQNENSSRCPLRVVPAAGGKRLFVCHLNRTQMFVEMDVQVHREGMLIHNRSLFVELVFFLDPPGNVTVSGTGQQGQLNVSWVPPPLKYMEDSMMYEVIYAPEDHHPGQVEVARASSELILRGLQSGTKYKVQVRVKLDGMSYNGYWSAWSDPVFMETLPAEFDPLILSLTLVISFVLILLCLTMLLSHQSFCSHFRFLIKKIWPTIPTPDGNFQGLFTVYGGDFQEWLGQTSGGLWLTPALVYSEERPSPLEVLSELSLCPSLSSPPLPPKASKALSAVRKEDVNNGLDERELLERGDSAVTDGWRPPPHDHWLMDRLQELHQHQASLLESQDAYVTLSTSNQGENGHVDDNFEEALPLEVLFASRKTVSCESHSDLGSVQQSSRSGRLSSQSSFEYPHQAWTAKGPLYTYMAVADSGVSMDYSPMSRVDDIGKVVFYAHDYKNEIPAHRRPLLSRQYPVHDEG